MSLIVAVAQVKQAAAKANQSIGKLDSAKAQAIAEVCHEVMDGKLTDQFVTDCLQGGAGTSINMNVNEVIANRGLELMGHNKGEYQHLHPNDHVNLSQSTNDVMPTALRLCLLGELGRLELSVAKLSASFSDKGETFRHTNKLGRTHLQDAVVISAGEQLIAYASMLAAIEEQFALVKQTLLKVNLGGTAVGTRESAGEDFGRLVLEELSQISQLPLTPAANLMASTRSLHDFQQASSSLENLASRLIQIANDIRLLASGPRGGIGELALPAIQNGSSIMPGKVNPVVPEVVDQIGFLVIGNHTTIMLASQAGQLELNTMFPVVALRLLESLELLTKACLLFAKKCVTALELNQVSIKRNLNESTALATKVAEIIGYDQASTLAKTAVSQGKGFLEVLKQHKVLSGQQLEELLQ